MESLLALTNRYDLDTVAWIIDPEDKPDFSFYESLIRKSPGLVMDAGCGTGRLLISLLQCGFQVEGCDISELLLTLCRSNADAAGFSPTLYHQPLQDLPFSNKYSVILLACGTFMCITESDEVDRCLATLHRNLVPGGRLALSIMPSSYLHLIDGPFPTPWEPYYEFAFPGDAGVLMVDWRATNMNAAEQIIDEECRYRWIKGGAIVREEVDPGRHRWYRRDRLAERLERAGFKDVEVYANYSEQPSFDETSPLCYVATRG